mgnify:CR=1 FL=1
MREATSMKWAVLILLGAAAGAQPKPKLKPKAAPGLKEAVPSWAPPEGAPAELVRVRAVCDALELAFREGDLETTLDLADFPVLYVPVGAPSTEVGDSWDRAHWMGLLTPALETTARNGKLRGEYEIELLSSSLALVLTKHSMIEQGRLVTWRSAMHLVLRDGKWKIKALAGKGWAEVPGTVQPQRPKQAQLPPAVELFNKRCATCHGKDGKGKTVVGEELGIPDLSDPAFQATFTDAEAWGRILDGFNDKETGRLRMPAFRDKYPEADLKELIPHMRSLARRKP